MVAHNCHVNFFMDLLFYLNFIFYFVFNFIFDLAEFTANKPSNGTAAFATAPREFVSTQWQVCKCAKSKNRPFSLKHYDINYSSVTYRTSFST